MRAGVDRTRELEPVELMSAQYLRYTSEIQDLSAASIYIVTVPTPIDMNKHPDLSSLIKASMAIGSVLSR